MNKINTISTFILILFATWVQAQGVAIDEKIYGQNAWYINITETNVNLFSADFDARISDIAASGVKYIRIGGIGVNFKPLYNISGTSIPDAPRLEHLINIIRDNGMEPIIEVGYNPVCSSLTPLGGKSLTDQKTIAGNLVNYLNNPSTGVYSSNPIRNWIISNEPDLGVSCTSPYGGFGYASDAASISTYLQEFSKAMKGACNSPNCTTITVIGAENASFSNDVYASQWTLMKNLIDDDALMGTISGGYADGKFILDGISFHNYPQNCTTRTCVIDNPHTVTLNGFRNKLSITGNPSYKGIAEIISTYSSRTTSNLKISCTEFNLGYNNTAYDESNATGYANMIKDVGFRSFLGGQWLAEIYLEAMESSIVQFMAPWSVREAGDSGDPCTDGRGYISACTTSVAGANSKRPTYWHYKMVAENFKGSILPHILANSGNYKAFAYKNDAANEIGAIVMNQIEGSNPTRETDTHTKTFKIKFDDGTAPTGADMLFQFDADNTTIGSGGTYSCTIAVETTMLLVFDATTGALKKRETYSLRDALRTSNSGNIMVITNASPDYLYDNYSDPSSFHSNITIGTGASITAGYNKSFTATNSITLNGPYSSNNKTLTLSIDPNTCYSNP